jgi:hypothetical protein
MYRRIIALCIRAWTDARWWRSGTRSRVSAHLEEVARPTRFVVAGDPATTRDGNPLTQIRTIRDNAIYDE